jgi:cysteine-rich repeat protein
MKLTRRPLLFLALALAACGFDPTDGQSAALGDGGTSDADGAGGDGAADSSADSTVGDATSDSNADASDAAAADSGGDAPSDAASSADAVSVFCGDGIRGLDEECDDGITSAGDFCTSLCEVRDQLAARPTSDGAAPPLRSLGTSRHPLATSASQIAVTWMETQAPVTLGMTFYSSAGVPTGAVDRFGVGVTASPYSSTAIAALPNGRFAVVFADQGGDGDGLGVVARLVDPNVASSGMPARINQITSSSQYDVDIVWTGSELVMAWTDLSVFPGDIRYRTFDSTLSPTSAEQTLAGTSAGEGTVSLSVHNGAFAAAWREISCAAHQLSGELT